MSASQFKVYTSSDASNPGLITGQAGSVLTVLDGCLVNGYGSKPAAGWTKPFANSGNIGCYKQGSGSGFSLLVNDNGANVTSTFKEAWLTGWESLTAITGPVGTGSGQFPTPAQLLTTGHEVIRKSNTADGTGRPWIVFADSATFYFFILTGDSANTYWACLFGDIFSFAGSADIWRCMLISGFAENSTTNDWDRAIGCVSGVAQGGHYIARNGFGTPGALQVDVAGNSTLGESSGSAMTGAVFGISGLLPTPNPYDNALYFSPLLVVERTVQALRGRFRGMYQVIHSSSNFQDGQTLQGSNDYAGKTFKIVKSGPNGGFVAIETSATVETN